MTRVGHAKRIHGLLGFIISNLKRILIVVAKLQLVTHSLRAIMSV